MPRLVRPLTDTKIKNAKPKARAYKLSDGQGLFLLITSLGSKLWRLKYRYNGKENLLSLGRYPEIGLIEARDRRLECRKLLAQGIDPSTERKKQKQRHQGQRFVDLANQWWALNVDNWDSKHAQKIKSRLERHVFPYIGDIAITELTFHDIVAVKDHLEGQELTDVPKRCVQYISNICLHAVNLKLILANPADGVSKTLKSHVVEHRPALPLHLLPQFLKDLTASDPEQKSVRHLGLRLLILTFLRNRELRTGRWSEIDFANQLWRIPAERMKGKKGKKRGHLIPLSNQAINILERIRSLHQNPDIIFPVEQGWKNEYLHENVWGDLLDKLGYREPTAHGFRTVVASLLVEQKFSVDAIEYQLSHAVKKDVHGTYTRLADFMDERRRMMQWWADYLDALEHDLPQSPIPPQQPGGIPSLQTHGSIEMLKNGV